MKLIAFDYIIASEDVEEFEDKFQGITVLNKYYHVQVHAVTRQATATIRGIILGAKTLG